MNLLILLYWTVQTSLAVSTKGKPSKQSQRRRQIGVCKTRIKPSLQASQCRRVQLVEFCLLFRVFQPTEDCLSDASTCLEPGNTKCANIAIVPPGHHSAPGRAAAILPATSYSPSLFVSMIDYERKTEKRGYKDASEDSIDDLFQTLLIDQQQQTWRELDRQYAPYCDSPVERRQIYLCHKRKERTQSSAAQDKSQTERHLKHSFRIADWLSLPLNDGPEFKLAPSHADIDSCFNLFNVVLQMPKDFSPFNMLRAQCPDKEEGRKCRNVDETKDGASSEAPKFYSTSSQRYHVRSFCSDARHDGTKGFRILDKWRSKSCIPLRIDRRIPKTFPQNSQVAVGISKPRAFCKRR